MTKRKALSEDRYLEKQSVGLIVKSVGGRYEMMTQTGERLACYARGAFRYQKMKLLVGDRVSFQREADGSVAVKEILPRKNALIRPPLANADMIFVVISAGYPSPDLLLTDKLITIAEYSHILPVVVVTKQDQNPQSAARIAEIYRKCGLHVFVTSGAEGRGIDVLSAFIAAECPQKISAVAGVSGAGKTTLLNALFPGLSLATGELSSRIERGKNTTRQVELFVVGDLMSHIDPALPAGYIADTPGFSLIDFTRFDFYKKEDLPFTFREFAPYLGKCRYTKCSHTKEQGCAVLAAVADGTIPPERHQSYCAIYADLKDKHDWDSR